MSLDESAMLGWLLVDKCGLKLDSDKRLSHFQDMKQCLTQLGNCLKQ